MIRQESRTARINRLANALVERFYRKLEKRERVGDDLPQKPMKRKICAHRPREMIAYDLETTRIAVGTPKPLYLTAYGKQFSFSGALQNGVESLREILVTQFLTPEHKRMRFVAWNGNGFDVFFIAQAILQSPDYLIRPYLTRSKSLRGLRIQRVDDPKMCWEFLDGISMTGLVGRPLKFFLKTFAPEYQKHEAPDWENEEFDARNPLHVAYAERDSEGLYHAITEAQKITLETVGIPLQPTIGNLGIKALMRHMPEGVNVWRPSTRAVMDIRKQAMRGGYCFLMRKYHGPVWKYDLNQAYAAAMRECDLPAGTCLHVTGDADLTLPGVARITAKNPHGVIPFYYKDDEGVSQFDAKEITNTWLTHSEVAQLESEGWKIEIHESRYWPQHFRMTEYVNKLEQTRINAPDGVNGATGLMVKAVGNNSYGKTVEQIAGLEMVMALRQPEGYASYSAGEDDEILHHTWIKFVTPLLREYHQPQIGAMITAHVRMQVRRAALIDPHAFLYADTDCVMSTRPLNLDIDPKRYGAWKLESAGEWYKLIAKKVYKSDDNKTKHAKGMNVSRLSPADLDAWYAGTPPVQKQIHRYNFVKFTQEGRMFREHEKTGQRVDTKIAA